MIEFNNNFIAVDQIESVERKSSGDSDYPYALSVYIKGERIISAKYQKKDKRDSEAYRIAEAVEREQQKKLDDIFCHLLNLKWTIQRIDKRQLRIWRQLKALLSLQGDEEGDDG